MASKEALAHLRKFTSCDIGDALLKLHHPKGGFLDGLKLLASPTQSPTPARIFGPAIPVQMVDVRDPDVDAKHPKPDMHFADANRKGGVMFISQPKGLPSACWGGLMSTRAMKLGAEAVVVDGRVRDLGEHRDMEFPVFARGVSILGSNGFTRAASIDVPVQFEDDLWINPGDIIVGDEDGVVVTPPSLVEQVVELCRARADVDEKMFRALREGAEMGQLIKNVRKSH